MRRAAILAYRASKECGAQAEIQGAVADGHCLRERPAHKKLLYEEGRGLGRVQAAQERCGAVPPRGVEREVRIASKGVSAHDASDEAAARAGDVVQIDRHVRRESAAAEGDVDRPRGALRITPGSVEDACGSAQVPGCGGGGFSTGVWPGRLVLGGAPPYGPQLVVLFVVLEEDLDDLVLVGGTEVHFDDEGLCDGLELPPPRVREATARARSWRC